MGNCCSSKKETQVPMTSRERMLALFGKQAPHMLADTDEVLKQTPPAQHNAMIKKYVEMLGPEPPEKEARKGYFMYLTEEDIAFRRRLRRFLAARAPKKIKSVETFAQEYKGREEELMALLVKMYGEEPSSDAPVEPPVGEKEIQGEKPDFAAEEAARQKRKHQKEKERAKQKREEEEEEMLLDGALVSRTRELNTRAILSGYHQQQKEDEHAAMRMRLDGETDSRELDSNEIADGESRLKGSEAGSRGHLAGVRPLRSSHSLHDGDEPPQNPLEHFADNNTYSAASAQGDQHDDQQERRSGSKDPYGLSSFAKDEQGDDGEEDDNEENGNLAAVLSKKEPEEVMPWGTVKKSTLDWILGDDEAARFRYNSGKEAQDAMAVMVASGRFPGEVVRGSGYTDPYDDGTLEKFDELVANKFEDDLKLLGPYDAYGYTPIASNTSSVSSSSSSVVLELTNTPPPVLPAHEYYY